MMKDDGRVEPAHKVSQSDPGRQREMMSGSQTSGRGMEDVKGNGSKHVSEITGAMIVALQSSAMERVDNGNMAFVANARVEIFEGILDLSTELNVMRKSKIG